MYFSNVNIDYKLELQQHNLHDKNSEVCINTRSLAALQPFIDLINGGHFISLLSKCKLVYQVLIPYSVLKIILALKCSLQIQPTHITSARAGAM